jgi:hypothetical protein
MPCAASLHHKGRLIMRRSWNGKFFPEKGNVFPRRTNGTRRELEGWHRRTGRYSALDGANEWTCAELSVTCGISNIALIWQIQPRERSDGNPYRHGPQR